MMNVMVVEENGIVLVWNGGVKDGEEVPVNYTQLPDVIPNWIALYVMLWKYPSFVEDLDTLGRGSHFLPSKVRLRSGRNAAGQNGQADDVSYFS